MTILKERKLKETKITLYDVANDREFMDFSCGFVYIDEITSFKFETNESIIRVAHGGNGKNVDHVTYGYEKNLKTAITVTNKMKIDDMGKTITFTDLSRKIKITFFKA